MVIRAIWIDWTFWFENTSNNWATWSTKQF